MSKDGLVQISVRLPEALKLRLEALGCKRRKRTGEAVSVSRELRYLVEEFAPEPDDQSPSWLLSAYEEAKKKLDFKDDTK